MPILIEELSVLDISFRWSGYDSRRFYFRYPLEVENNFRNLMNAILTGELGCLTISLEKRDYAEDEKETSVYYWIDDIYACIGAQHFNKKLLRYALINRYDFKQWCERMNIPLPEFWFPQGWNLEYDLPEYDDYPGYGYERKDWTSEQWAEYAQERREYLNKSVRDNPLEATSKDKMRPSQEARLACQQIAKAIWKDHPDRTIASVVKDELIQKYGGSAPYAEDTVRQWVKSVAPSHVSDRRGRPRKNVDKDKT